MEEAISNSINELSIIIEPEPESSQVTEETVVTDNNTEKILQRRNILAL